MAATAPARCSSRPDRVRARRPRSAGLHLQRRVPDKPVIFCAPTATDGLFLASRQKLDKFDWSMLNGKKIMGWRPGSTPQLYLEYVLKQRGVAADTIKSIVTNIGMPARDGPSSPAGSISPSSTSRTCRRWRSAGQAKYGGLDRQGSRPRRLHAVLRQEELGREESRPRAEMDQRDRARPVLDEDRERKDVAEAIAPFFPASRSRTILPS